MSKNEATVLAKGTPFEVGAGIWEKLVLPCLKGVEGQPIQQVQQLYAGLLGGCMGAMVADFGHEKAVSILRTLADSLDTMRDEFSGSKIQ